MLTQLFTFFIFIILLTLGYLQSIDASLCDGLSHLNLVYVDDASDRVADSSNCEFNLRNTYTCNFRSAISFCLENVNASETCVIVFDTTLAVIDSQYGDISIVDTSISFIIHGCGVLIQSDYLFEANFMTIESSQTNLEMYNFEIIFFGYENQNGGVILIRALNSLVLKSITFFKGTANRGGALYLQNIHNVTLDNCDFKNGRAKYGAAIYIGSGVESVAMTSLHFEYNLAEVKGGAISLFDGTDDFHLLDSSFFSNAAGKDGGAIYLTGSHMNLMGNVFIGDGAKYNGGSVNIIDASDVVINNCTFIDAGLLYDYTPAYGGSIHVEKSDFISIVSSNFKGGYAKYGGGISLHFTKHATVENCFFDGIHADFVGAGLFGNQFNEVNILYNTFGYGVAWFGGGLGLMSNNVATIHANILHHNLVNEIGGGVFSDTKNSITISFCHFLKNNAGYVGGGIGTNGETTLMNILSNQFIGNSANNGGGIGYKEGCISCSSLHNNYSTNYAQSYGGGVYARNIQFGHFENDTYHKNKAQWSGGGIYIYSPGSFKSYLKLINSRFYANIVDQDSGSAVYFGKAYSLVANNTFDSNVATKGSGAFFWMYHQYDMPQVFGLLTDGNIFQNNSAGFGADYASQGMYLGIYLNGNENKNESLPYYLTNFDNVTVEVYLLDYYGQKVIAPFLGGGYIAVATGDISDCNGLKSFVTGEKVAVLDLGYAKFTSFSPHCYPGGTMNIEFYHNRTSNVGVGISDAVVPKVTSLLKFRKCVRGEVYDDRACMVCPEGSFSLGEGPEQICKKQPSAAINCYADQINVKAGYWRISTDAVTLLPCPLGASACKGGWAVDEELCDEGYKGPLCAVCDDGYYLTSSQVCQACESSNVNPFTVAFLCLIGLFAIFAVVKSCSGVGYLDSSLVDNANFEELLAFIYVTVYIGRALSLDEKVKIKQSMAEYFDRLQKKLKIYVTLYQILTSLPFVLNLTFPRIVTRAISVFNFVNMNFSEQLGLSCRFTTDYIDVLVYSTLAPIVLSVALFILQFIHYVYLKSKKVELQQIKTTRATYFYVFLVFTYLILPGVSTIIFRTFSCENVDPDGVVEGDNWYLRADYSISCTSDRYYFGRNWAIAMAIIYVLGIPIFYFFSLYNIKDRIINRTDASEKTSYSLSSTKFLYDSYEPQYWYWEIVETIQRLLLTGVLVLILEGTTLQIVVGIVIALVFIKLYGYCRPFEEGDDNFDKEVCQWQVFCVLFLGLLIKQDSMTAYDMVLSILIIIAVFMNLILDFVTEVYKIVMIRCLGKSYDDVENDGSSGKSNNNKNDAGAGAGADDVEDGNVGDLLVKKDSAHDEQMQSTEFIKSSKIVPFEVTEAVE